MTVQKLRNILEDYPSSMNVKVAIKHQIADLNCVNLGVDMDTNQKSVWLCHEKAKQRDRDYDYLLQHWDEFCEQIYGGNLC